MSTTRLSLLPNLHPQNGLDTTTTYFWVRDWCEPIAEAARVGEVVRQISRTVLFLDSWSGSKTLERAWVVWQVRARVRGWGAQLNARGDERSA